MGGKNGGKYKREKGDLTWKEEVIILEERIKHRHREREIKKREDKGEIGEKMASRVKIGRKKRSDSIQRGQRKSRRKGDEKRGRDDLGWKEEGQER